MINARAFARVVILMLCILTLGHLTIAGELPAGSFEISTNTYFSRFSYSSEDQHLYNISNLSISSGIGYCVSRVFEPEGFLLIEYTNYDPEVGEGSSATAIGFSGNAVLNFPMTGPMVPFVQCGFMVLDYSGDGYETAKTAIAFPAFAGGIRFLIGNSASLNSGLSYAHWNNTGGVDQLTCNAISFSLGISILISHKQRSGHLRF